MRTWLVQRALRDLRRAKRAEQQCEALERELAVVRMEKRLLERRYERLDAAYVQAVLAQLEETP